MPGPGPELIIAVLAATAVALGGILGYVTVTIHRDRLLERRTQDELASKYTNLTIQTAMAVFQTVDQRVKERVGFVNAILRRDGDAPGLIEPLAEMPPISVTANEEGREMKREQNRKRRPGVPDTRDLGVGVESGVGIGMPSIDALRAQMGLPPEGAAQEI